MIRVHAPQIQVKLIKLVSRRDGVAERYARAEREIDLTPFLGETGTVRTARGVRECSGGFTIAVADRVHAASGDSLYALVEGMDMVEIRMARWQVEAGEKLPLVMRGFVTTIRRKEGMGADGKPSRMVVIQGQDFGKLWEINHILFQLGLAQELPMLTTFQMQVVTGLDIGYLPVGRFMAQLVERVVNEKIAKLSAIASRNVPKFVSRVSVEEGACSVNLAGGYQGAVWGLVEMFADRPWNEAFIEDTEDGPAFVFRPAPYRTIEGEYIMPGASDPGTIERSIADVVDLDLSRGDQRVANFFWVPPGASMLDSGNLVTAQALASGQPLDFEYGNNRPELFGVRLMQVSTTLLPTDLRQAPAVMDQDGRQQAAGDIVLWHQRRAAQLKAMNRDNSVLEEGSATLMGSEEFKAGRYLRLTRGTLTAEAYISRVTHAFSPGQGWTTGLALERCTGFLERNKLDGSPYWGEGRRGAYGR